jgi:hypothetical protein
MHRSAWRPARFGGRVRRRRTPDPGFDLYGSFLELVKPEVRRPDSLVATSAALKPPFSALMSLRIPGIPFQNGI